MLAVRAAATTLPPSPPWACGVTMPPSRVMMGAAMSTPKRPPPPSPSAPERQGEAEVLERTRTDKPRLFKVIFHNDDYTTQEFVIQVLKEFFFKSDAEATHIMLTVHKKGAGVAGVYPRDVAETKANLVMGVAREHGMPLLLTTEPE